jgi:putative effector of murein hydrolase
LVLLTGVLGALIGVPIMRLMKVRDEATQGLTLGLTAHAIGTARALETGPTCGAFSALAMGLTGMLTALLLPWLAG